MQRRIPVPKSKTAMKPKSAARSTTAYNASFKKPQFIETPSMRSRPAKQLERTTEKSVRRREPPSTKKRPKDSVQEFLVDKVSCDMIKDYQLVFTDLFVEMIWWMKITRLGHEPPLDWYSSVLPLRNPGPPATKPYDSTLNYLDWFSKSSLLSNYIFILRIAGKIGFIRELIYKIKASGSESCFALVMLFNTNYFTCFYSFIPPRLVPFHHNKFHSTSWKHGQPGGD